MREGTVDTAAAMTVEILTDRLGGSALAEAIVSGRAPSGWVTAAPRGSAAWTERVTGIQGAASRELPRAVRPAFGPVDGAARDRLDRALRDGVVVTTGQQPGLFGGPLYTWHKALSALALADMMERTTGSPVAPVFWAATDDTDFLEASSTVVAAPGGPITIRMQGKPTEGIPMADVPLGSLSAEIEMLARGAGSATHFEFLEMVRSSYTKGATVGSAYVALLRAVLEPLGIAVLDASHEAVRLAADAVCRRALRDADRIADAVKQRSQELRSAGFEPQVAEVAGLSLVFERSGSGASAIRNRVPLRDGRQAADRAQPGTLGPNVLLRPIVERALLPTVAYVAGPGEIAYFAQVSAVADALGLEQPMPVPRWSGTIIEPHVRRILDRHALTPDALRDPHAVERRLAGDAIPEAVQQALETLREHIDESARDLAITGRSLAVPETVFEGTRRAIGHRLDRLERRLRAAAARRASAAIVDIRTARGALYPDGKRQERSLNMIPLLARHGAALLDRIRGMAGDHARRIIDGSGETR